MLQQAVSLLLDEVSLLLDEAAKMHAGRIGHGVAGVISGKNGQEPREAFQVLISKACTARRSRRSWPSRRPCSTVVQVLPEARPDVLVSDWVCWNRTASTSSGRCAIKAMTCWCTDSFRISFARGATCEGRLTTVRGEPAPSLCGRK